MNPKESVSAGLSTKLSSDFSEVDFPTHEPPAYGSSIIENFQNPLPHLLDSPVTVLTVYAPGSSWCRVPTPPKELETFVFTGTDTSAEPLYVSTRATRRSGNAVLQHLHRGDLLATRYKFGYGPNRDPKIRRLDGNYKIKASPHDCDDAPLAVEVKPHWLSNSVDLTVVDDGRVFTWEYIKTQTFVGKQRVLALSTKTPSASKADQEKVIAVLLRVDDTRTPGTTKSHAGNGGQLILDSAATSYIDEALIVATCLMMLKREIDRQRSSQIAAWT